MVAGNLWVSHGTKDIYQSKLYPQYIHLEKKYTWYFLGFVRRFFSDRVQKLVVCLGLYEYSLHFLRREDQLNGSLGTLSKISFPYVNI